MSGIVTVTGLLAVEMSQIYGVPQGHIWTVANGANTSLFRPLDRTTCLERVRLDSRLRWVCFVGGLNPWYDVPTLIAAVARARAREPKVALVVVGDGPTRPHLESLVRKTEMQGVVTFAGNVPYEEVPFYIGASEVGVAPLTSERNERIGVSPLKVYEYLACGRPVVVTRVPGVADWIEAERLGYVARPGDPVDLSEKIGSALADGEMQQRILAEGWAIIDRTHSWKQVASRIIQICEGLAGPPTPG